MYTKRKLYIPIEPSFARNPYILGFNFLIYEKSYFIVKISIENLQLPKINKRTVQNKIIQVGKNTKN